MNTNSSILRQEIRDKIWDRCPRLGNFDPNNELYKLWYNQKTGVVIYYNGWNRVVSDELNHFVRNVENLIWRDLEEYEF